jgi:hypothetical protein
MSANRKDPDAESSTAAIPLCSNRRAGNLYTLMCKNVNPVILRCQNRHMCAQKQDGSLKKVRVVSNRRSATDELLSPLELSMSRFKIICETQLTDFKHPLHAALLQISIRTFPLRSFRLSRFRDENERI